MRTHRTFVDLLIRSVMAVLLGIGLAMLLSNKAVAGDIRLDEIKTRTDVYRDVTVTEHNETDLFITHSMGMANVKIKDLDAETLWRVGLGPEPESPEAVAAAEAAANDGKFAPALAKMFESSTSAMEPAAEGQVLGMSDEGEGATVEGFTAHLKEAPSAEEVIAQLKSSLPILFGALGVALLFWLFFCFCLKLIIEKTGTRAGFMVWLPVLNWFPALRAANMSGWWLGFPLSVIAAVLGVGTALMLTVGASPILLFLAIPYLLALIVFYIGELRWCIKIVEARGKSGWFALFMVLSILSPLATPLGLFSESIPVIYNLVTGVLAMFSFLYLAFSSSEYGSHYSDRANDGRIVVPSAFSQA